MLFRSFVRLCGFFREDTSRKWVFGVGQDCAARPSSPALPISFFRPPSLKKTAQTTQTFELTIFLFCFSMTYEVLVLCQNAFLPRTNRTRNRTNPHKAFKWRGKSPSRGQARPSSSHLNHAARQNFNHPPSTHTRITGLNCPQAKRKGGPKPSPED